MRLCKTCLPHRPADSKLAPTMSTTSWSGRVAVPGNWGNWVVACTPANKPALGYPWRFCRLSSDLWPISPISVDPTIGKREKKSILETKQKKGDDFANLFFFFIAPNWKVMLYPMENKVGGRNLQLLWNIVYLSFLFLLRKVCSDIYEGFPTFFNVDNYRVTSISVVYLLFRLHDDKLPFLSHLPLESTERLLLAARQEKMKQKQTRKD